MSIPTESCSPMALLPETGTRGRPHEILMSVNQACEGKSTAKDQMLNTPCPRSVPYYREHKKIQKKKQNKTFPAALMNKFLNAP